MTKRGFVALFLLAACAKSIEQDSAPVSNLSDGLAVDDHRVFVTSTTFANADLNADPNDICETHAVLAGLERDYVAIISDSTGDAIDRVVAGGGEVYKFTSTGLAIEVAASVDALWEAGSDNLISPIDRDEDGIPVAESAVLTGTDNNGFAESFGGTYCANFTDSAGGMVIVGSTLETGSEYIYNEGTSCASPVRLYCISQ